MCASDVCSRPRTLLDELHVVFRAGDEGLTSASSRRASAGMWAKILSTKNVAFSRISKIISGSHDFCLKNPFICS